MSHLHTPAWEVYFCHIEEQPAFVSVDLAVAEFAPITEKPNLIEVAIGLRTTDEEGFPEAEEWEMLEKIEDSLVQLLEEKLNVTFVGKTLHSGKRAFYFYGDQVLLLDGYVEEVKKQYPEYLVVSQATEDPEWEIYFDYLYPDAESMQRIRNNQMLLLLAEQGDQSFVPRKITHWLYFKTAPDREAAWKELVQKGYTLEEKAQDPAEKENPFKLTISKTDKADEETIDETTGALWLIAEQHDGEYDGWETEVISENA